MAIRAIVTESDDILTKRSRPVEVFDKRLRLLLDDMIDTLKESGGVGLAAVQVGILRRVFIMEMDDGEILEFVNAEILASGGSVEGLEGCLSVPGIYGYCLSPETVCVKAQDRNGVFFMKEFSGLYARCSVHEIEHFEGKLFRHKVIRYATQEELEGR